MPESSATGAKAPTAYCDGCPGVHTLDLFEDSLGNTQQKCYIWQIVSHVNAALSPPRDIERWIAEGVNIGRGKLRLYREALKDRKPAIDVDSYYSEGDLMDTLKKELRKKVLREEAPIRSTSARTTEQTSLTSSAAEHQPDNLNVDAASSEQPQVAISISSSELSEREDTPEIIESQCPDTRPSSASVDPSAPEPSPHKGNPATNPVTGVPHRGVPNGMVTRAASSRTVGRNLRSKLSTICLDNESSPHTQELCNGCGKERHSAHFRSPKKKTKECWKCICCRSKQRAERAFEKANRDKPDAAIVQDLKKVISDFINGWREDVLSISRWSEEELNPIIQAVRGEIDSIVIEVCKSCGLEQPPRSSAAGNRKRPTGVILEEDEDESQESEATSRGQKTRRLSRGKTLTVTHPRSGRTELEAEEEISPATDHPLNIQNLQIAAGVNEMNFENRFVKFFQPIIDRNSKLTEILVKCSSLDPQKIFEAFRTVEDLDGETNTRSRDRLAEHIDNLLEFIEGGYAMFEWRNESHPF